MIPFFDTPPDRSTRDEALDLAVEFQRGLAPVVRALGCDGRHGLSVRLTSASSGAVLYLEEAGRLAEPRGARSLCSNAAGCVLEAANLLELLRQLGLLTGERFHRLRILSIRLSRALAPLAASPLGDLRLTKPGHVIRA